MTGEGVPGSADSEVRTEPSAPLREWRPGRVPGPIRAPGDSKKSVPASPPPNPIFQELGFLLLREPWVSLLIQNRTIATPETHVQYPFPLWTLLRDGAG